jgi:ABC-type dipeptide/oligopeptide/nickel transport system ATPase component
MKDLQQQIGCAVLFISHHLGVIAELCDEMIVMYAGEVVEKGSVRQIFKGARHPYRNLPPSAHRHDPDPEIDRNLFSPPG